MKKFALGVVVGAALGHIVYEYAPEIERGVLALRRQFDLWLIRQGIVPASRDDRSYYPPPGY